SAYRIAVQRMPNKLNPAFLVHVLTASGAAWALLALHAAVQGRWPAMFLWLGVAVTPGAVGGALGPWCNGPGALPRWSGGTIELGVDFVTYVFVPAYAIVAAGLMPDVLALPCGIVIVVTGALYFADRRMKMADNHFRGFPTLWNVAAFYLLLLR